MRTRRSPSAGGSRAERNACETRDGLLQVESEQVRARLAEIDLALHQARAVARPVTRPPR